MIRFIHTADIHIGMENYGKIDPSTGIHTRLLDFAKALTYCIDVAIAQKVDFFLFCGDAYKTPHPTQTQQRLLIQSLLRLHAAGIPVVIIVGNHDHPLSFGKAHALDLFNEFPLASFHVIAKPQTITLQTAHGPINIFGIPWPTRNMIALKQTQTSSHHITHYISQAVSHLIAQEAQRLDPTIPAILAAHMTVSNGVFSGSEKRAVYGTDPLFLPSQLAIEPFDYVALGHLHRHQNLNPHGTIPIVYAGSIERIDFGERKEPKGFCLVTIKAKHEVTYEFIEGPMRPFIQIEVTLTAQAPQTQQLIEAVERHPIADAIIKILYYLPEGIADTVDLKEVQHVCQSAHYIVGIIPVRAVTKRTRRTESMKVGMDMPALLRDYFEQKKELQTRREYLLEKALSLLEEEEG
jgi:exonuclease SbcD